MIVVLHCPTLSSFVDDFVDKSANAATKLDFEDVAVLHDNVWFEERADASGCTLFNDRSQRDLDKLQFKGKHGPLTVRMIEPCSSVVPCERKLTISATPKTRSAVEPSWSCFPFRRPWTRIGG